MTKRRQKGSGLATSGGHTIDTLKKYAIAGAEAALAALRAEITIIERTFPELATARGRGRVIATVEKRTSRITAAGRAALSKRMKKYWAERRKAAATATDGGAAGSSRRPASKPTKAKK